MQFKIKYYSIYNIKVKLKQNIFSLRIKKKKILQNHPFFMNMAEPATPDTKWVSKLNFSA